jgi:hypothetical protein
VAPTPTIAHLSAFTQVMMPAFSQIQERHKSPRPLCVLQIEEMPHQFDATPSPNPRGAAFTVAQPRHNFSVFRHLCQLRNGKCAILQAKFHMKDDFSDILV